MDIYMQVYIEKIDKNELQDACFEAIFDFYTKRDYYMKNLPNTEVLKKIATFISEKVDKFYNIDQLEPVKFIADLDDRDKLEDMAWAELVQSFYWPLQNFIPTITYTPEETDKVKKEGEQVLVYESDNWSCFFPNKINLKGEN